METVYRSESPVFTSLSLNFQDKFYNHLNGYRAEMDYKYFVSDRQHGLSLDVLCWDILRNKKV